MAVRLHAVPAAAPTSRHTGNPEIGDPPAHSVGRLSADVRHISEVARIDENVSKYRTLAKETRLPLIVAAGAHRFTGLGVEQLDHLLKGEHTFTVQFNPADTYIHEPLLFQPGNPPRWAMPPQLAGVLWVDNTFPFTTRWRPNPDARTLAPTRLIGNWSP